MRKSVAQEVHAVTSEDVIYNQDMTDNASHGCPNPEGPASNSVIAAVIGILLVAGLLGNSVTVTVIIRNKNLRTSFNMFLISLCASDLVSACICSPLWVYRRTWGFDDWLWGEWSCRLYWLSDMTTNFTTALHILSFCVLRYLALSRPFTAPTSRLSRNHFRIYIACLWILSLLISSLYAYMAQVKDDALDGDQWPSCSFGLEYKEVFHIYTSVTYSLFFYLPTIIILVLSIVSTRLLSESTESSSSSQFHGSAHAERIRQRNRTAQTQLQLICVCFAFGYLPITSYHIWASSGDTWECSSYTADYWIGIITYVGLRISECLNPVMYNLGSKEMRQATLRLIREDILRRPTTTTRRTDPRPSTVSNPYYSSRHYETGNTLNTQNRPIA